MFREHSLQKSCQNRLPSATFNTNIYSSVFGLTKWTHCWQVQGSIEGFVGVSKSPLTQTETLAKSIRGALHTVDLKSASVSETAWVWIITSKAFTVDACREKKKSQCLVFYWFFLCLAHLFSNNIHTLACVSLVAAHLFSHLFLPPLCRFVDFILFLHLLCLSTLSTVSNL